MASGSAQRADLPGVTGAERQRRAAIPCACPDRPIAAAMVRRSLCGLALSPICLVEPRLAARALVLPTAPGTARQPSPSSLDMGSRIRHLLLVVFLLRKARWRAVPRLE